MLYLESGFPKSVEAGLEQMGYALRPTEGVARVEAIVMKNGTLEGGTQSRFHGKVASY